MIGSRGGSRTYRVTKYRDGRGSRERDALAVEEPMEIRLAWVDGGHKRVEALAVTMRTPGHDFELVAGFLHGEGVISADDPLMEPRFYISPQIEDWIEGYLREACAPHPNWTVGWAPAQSEA